MKIIYVEVGKPAVKLDVENKLEKLQSLVGGLIDVSSIPDVPKNLNSADIVVNDEGLILGLPVNRLLLDHAGKFENAIFGNFFICGHRDSEFVSLNNEQIKYFLKRFKHPALVIGHDGKLDVIQLHGNDVSSMTLVKM